MRNVNLYTLKLKQGLNSVVERYRAILDCVLVLIKQIECLDRVKTGGVFILAWQVWITARIDVHH